VNDDTFVGRRGSALTGSAVIGVVVAIPEPWAQLLTDWRSKVGDPQALLVPPHVTLLPPTEVLRSERPAISAHLADVARRHPSFTMHLSGTGTFRPVSPVVFVGVVDGISACEQLALSVRRGPLAVEVEFPYHPHVTIAHHQPEEVLDRAFKELSAFECEFQVEEFWLYTHDEASGWSPAREFPLTAASD
jgi:2'-5' RNA ligase